MVWNTLKDLCDNKWLSGKNHKYPIYSKINKDMMEMKEERGTRIFSIIGYNFESIFL